MQVLDIWHMLDVLWGLRYSIVQCAVAVDHCNVCLGFVGFARVCSQICLLCGCSILPKRSVQTKRDVRRSY